MIFFWKSKEARTRWGRLFMGSSHLASNQRADESSNIYVDDEVDYDDCELPSDDTIVTRILSVRVSPASVAVALQAQGSLDIENNVIGLAGRVDGFPSDSVLSGLHDGSRPTDGGIELSSMSPAFGTESSIADDASATAPDSSSDLASDSTHEPSGALVSPHCPASPAACPLDPAVSTAST